MIQISYVSRATAAMSAEDLLALLRQCLANNPGNEVTGMLFYANNTFLQALEGEEEDVDRLLSKINSDPRNTDVQLLHRREISRREYSDWSMGFRRVTPELLAAAGANQSTDLESFNPLFLVQHKEIVEQLFREHVDPRARDAGLAEDPRDQLVHFFKTENTRMRGRVELALLMLESITDATRNGILTDQHRTLCEEAVQALRQI
jgi:Sensors of blue-light using FAD